MRERFFEQGARVNKKVEAVDRELSDAGISDPSEWRKAIDLETPLEVEEVFKRHVVKRRQIKARTEVRAGKIEDVNWQNQLNTAFQQGDFSLIKILQRVRPDNFPDPELVKNKLNELVVSRQSGWEKIYEAIREISSIKPDATVIEVEFSKLFEKYGREKDILDNLKTFIRATGFNPSIEQTQAKYRSVINDRKSYIFKEGDLFENIRELTGVKPDSSLIEEIVEGGNIRRAKELSPLFGFKITSEILQRAYEYAFAKRGYIDTYLIDEIVEKPNEELVQRVYQKIIEERNDRWINLIQSLRKATGIQPVFTEEQVRPFFEEYLNRGWYDGVKGVVELTGIRPDVAIVQARALKVIDEGHGYNNKGNRIIEGIKHLSKSVGIEFEISESEIQDRYQKAMAEKKPHIITNLYGAFEIKPSVDRETARRFMVGLMDETYNNPIPELEKVFGVKFKATKEEIEARQDENLEKLRFDNLAKITELTGKDVDRQKLETAIAQLLEKEATIPDKYGLYNRDWEKEIKQRLDQFGVVIPTEIILNIYTTLVQNELLHSDNLAKVHQLTGVPIPEGLVQQAYHKFLSPNYAYSVMTDNISCRVTGSVSSAFEKLFKVSGIKPEISEDQLQIFYRSCLEKNLFNEYKINEIKKLSEITGVKPEFDSHDINLLYKQLIFGGRENRIIEIKEVTGIELKLDQETLIHISGQIESVIEKARSNNYEREVQHEKKFDRYQLIDDLSKVSSLIAATEVKPDLERLQSTYADILATDPDWATKIIQIVEATGIKPVLSPEQLQAKGQELLENGGWRSFEHLQEYGIFTFTPEVVAKTYDALLATNCRYYELVDQIKRFKEITGIAPTKTQLAEIFFHISQYSDSVEETIKFFVENFQTDISAGMVKDIALSYLAREDVGGMGKFIKEVGVTPELTDEDILPHINRLLESRRINGLAYLKQEMKLAHLPTTEAVVQSTYQHFASQDDFGKESSKSLQAFKLVFELTGVPVNFPAEQTDQVYKSIRFAEWQKMNEIIGTLPSNEVVQYKYLQFFIYRHNDLEKNIEAIRKLTSQSPDAETISKALEHFALEGKLEEMLNIIKIAGGKPAINHESGQKAYRKVIENFNSSSSRNWGKKLVEAIDFLNDTLGIRPDGETMYQIYSKTFGQNDYKNVYEGPDGKRIYPQFWEFLIKKFGKPDPEVVQRIYLAQLAA